MVCWSRESGIKSRICPNKDLSDFFAIFERLMVVGFVVEILNRSQTNKYYTMSLFFVRTVLGFQYAIFLLNHSFFI